MNQTRLETAMRNGVKMPDGRLWTWCGHEWLTNKRGERVRVEIWASACRWCGSEFKIKQKLLGGRPAYNFQIQNCPEHRGQRVPKLSELRGDGSDLI